MYEKKSMDKNAIYHKIKYRLPVGMDEISAYRRNSVRVVLFR